MPFINFPFRLVAFLDPDNRRYVGLQDHHRWRCRMVPVKDFLHRARDRVQLMGRDYLHMWGTVGLVP